MWRHYLPDSLFLIYVVDANDEARMEENREVLHQLLSEEALRGVPLAILANKQDLPNALSAQDIMTQLNLFYLQDRPYHVI